LVSSDKEGEQIGRSQRKRTVVKPRKLSPHEKRRVGDRGSAETIGIRVEGQRHRGRNWVKATDGLPVVSEDDRSRKYANKSTDPLLGRLGGGR
jgi:hypothetical protein